MIVAVMLLNDAGGVFGTFLRGWWVGFLKVIFWKVAGWFSESFWEVG